MLPEWRPSRPLSTGPTLFLAPSPMAWQARHLLNEVFPASASCASALEAAVNEVTTTSAFKIGVFMWCSSSLFPDGGAVACGTARFAWTSHETVTGFGMPGLPERELIVWRAAI